MPACAWRRRKVSIHASAWEATAGAGSHGDLDRGFNPRLRMGGDGSVDGSTITL